MKASSKILMSGPTDGVIVLSGYHDATFEVAGCSCNCSARPKSAGLNSVAITEPTKGGDHFIALRVTWTEGSGKSKNHNGVNFLIPIITDTSFGVDLENSWIPTADCLIQMDGYGYLEVRIEEDIFTTKTLYGADKENANLHGDVDGNLMCRYAVGLVDADAFREQVASWNTKISLQEQLKTANQQLSEMTGKLSNSIGHAVRLEDDLDLALKTNAKNAALVAELDRLIATCQQIWANKPNWFSQHYLRRELAQALNNFLMDIRETPQD